MWFVSQVGDRANAVTLPTRPHVLYVISLFISASAAGATLYFNYSMSGGMPMPGEWTISLVCMSIGDNGGQRRAFRPRIVGWSPV